MNFIDIEVNILEEFCLYLVILNLILPLVSSIHFDAIMFVGFMLLKSSLHWSTCTCLELFIEI